VESPGSLLILALSAGVMVAAIELVSPLATDNLTVPIASGFLLFVAATERGLYGTFVIGEILSSIVAAGSYRIRFLTLDGAVGTFILGGFIFGLGGWTWSLPILLFFVTGSLASRLFADKKAGYNLLYEKSHVRDAGQVFANGGIALLILCWSIVLPDYHWFLAYVGTICAVTSDTVATEIGVFSKGNPFSIAEWRRVEKGTSGGVSLLGTGAGLLATILLASITLPLAVDYSDFPLRFVAAASIGGALGSITDSLIGATIQSQFSCPACGKVTEGRIHCGTNSTLLQRGYGWINNDVVNFAASLIGGIACPLLFRAL